MLLLLVACVGAGPPDTAVETDTDVDSDTDTDTDSDTDTDTVEVLAANLGITVHPSVSTVLIASWEQVVEADSWLAWELEGEAFESPRRRRAIGSAAEEVFGLPGSSSTTITLHVVEDGVEQTLPAVGTTGVLPDPGLQATTVLIDRPERSDSRWFLTSVNVGEHNFFGPCYVVILDRLGRVVWYREVSDDRLTLFPRVARSGTHVLWDATTYYASGVEPSISRATLSLSQTEEVFVAGLGFTWDEDVDGSWLFDEAETPYDYHLSRYRDGVTERIWACAPWMAVYSTEYWACAGNTALAGGDAIVYSMFETSTVVGIDPESGEVAWELGEYPGGLTFVPEGIHLQLQHYPNWTPDGTLLLTSHVEGAREQHIREFALDLEAGTATQVWDYAAQAGYYGDYAGEATRLSGGNTLISFGTDGVVQEVTPDLEVVWELDWSDHLLGHLTPIDDLYALDEGW